MPKGRMINKTISVDEKLAQLSPKTIILYTFSIPHLDSEGKILADSQILKGVVVPYLNFMSIGAIHKCKQELKKSPLVTLYGENDKYMRFNGFMKNQNLQNSREAPSRIPNPTHDQLKSNSGVTLAEENRIEENRRVVEKTSTQKSSSNIVDTNFIDTLRTNLAYRHLDIDGAAGQARAWISAHPGREYTKRFLVNWLNSAAEKQPKKALSKAEWDPDGWRKHAKLTKKPSEIPKKSPEIDKQ